MAQYCRRFSIVVLAFLLLISNISISKAQTRNTDDSYKEIVLSDYDSTELNKSILMLNEEESVKPLFNSNDIVRVSIILDSSPVLKKGYSSYKIGNNSLAMNYRDTLIDEHNLVLSRIENTLSKSIIVKADLTLALNAISAEVEYSDIEAIKKIEGVKKVIIENIYFVDSGIETNTMESAFTSEYVVGAQDAWDKGYTGAGTRIAIIDTGIDLQHIAFNQYAFQHSLEEIDPTGKKYDLMTAQDLNVYKLTYPLNSGDGAAYISPKIPYVYNYVTHTTVVEHCLTKLNNHGTHVAGIAAANKYIMTPVATESEANGTYIDETGAEKFAYYELAAITKNAVGMAPDAQLFVMNVFQKIDRNEGAYDSTIMLAIEDAIYLECDTVNLSLGSAGGVTYNDDYAECYDLLASGEYGNENMTFCFAAGNEYSIIHQSKIDVKLTDVHNGTVAAPSTYIKSLSVASSRVVDVNNTDNPSSVMATSSSWGCASSLLMKPEITAPGNRIYAAKGAVNEGDPHDAYVYKSGTSMASPHIAGLSTILSQYLNSFNLYDANYMLANNYTKRAIIQSLLMSTSTPLKDGEKYYPVLQQGAGLANVNKALNSKTVIMMSETDSTLTARTGAASDGKVKVELGDDPDRTGYYTYTFRIFNITDLDVHFKKPSTNVFTQDHGFGTNPKMLETTVYAGEQVKYTWSVVNVDINRDSYTDEKDLSVLLDYLSGIVSGEDVNLQDADLDHDGEITSYDAYLFAGNLNSDTYVPAHGYADVSISFSFSVDNKYTNGAYIEGYTFLEEIRESGEEELIIHSIPILGFYGDWCDATMYGNGDTFDGMYFTGRKYFPDLDYSYLSLVYDYEPVKFKGNQYKYEMNNPINRIAINSSTIISAFYPVLNSSAGTYKSFIAKIDDYGGDITNILYTNDAQLYFGYQEPAKINHMLAEYGLVDGDHVRIGFYAIQELMAMKLHYESYGNMADPDSGILTDEQFRELLLSDKLYDGQYLGYDFVIDNKEPDITYCEIDPDTGRLIINVTDNHNVAYIKIMSFDLSETYIERTPASDDCTLSLDVSKILESGSGSVIVYAADYACNSTEMLVRLSDNGEFNKELYGIVNDSNDHSSLVKLNANNIYDVSTIEEFDFEFVAGMNMLDANDDILMYFLDVNNELYCYEDGLTNIGALETDVYDIAQCTVTSQKQYNVGVGIYDYYLSLFDVRSGDTYINIPTDDYFDGNCLLAIAADVTDLKYEDPNDQKVGYYVLDDLGNIWYFVLHMGDPRYNPSENQYVLSQFRKVVDTGIAPKRNRNMSFDGHYLYWLQNDNTGNELIIINIENGLFSVYDIEGDNKYVSLFEILKLPGFDTTNNIHSIKIYPEISGIIEGRSTVLSFAFDTDDTFNKNVYWYSTDPDVASVDQYGLLYANTPGTTTIICETRIKNCPIRRAMLDLSVYDDDYLSVELNAVVNEFRNDDRYIVEFNTDNLQELNILPYDDSNAGLLYKAFTMVEEDGSVSDYMYTEDDQLFRIDNSSNTFNKVEGLQFTDPDASLFYPIGMTGGPIAYQRAYGEAVSISGWNSLIWGMIEVSFVNILNIRNGEEIRYLRTIHNPGDVMSALPCAIASRHLNDLQSEYYVLKKNGDIWRFLLTYKDYPSGDENRDAGVIIGVQGLLTISEESVFISPGIEPYKDGSDSAALYCDESYLYYSMYSDAALGSTLYAIDLNTKEIISLGSFSNYLKISSLYQKETMPILNRAIAIDDEITRVDDLITPETIHSMVNATIEKKADISEKEAKEYKAPSNPLISTIIDPQMIDTVIMIQEPEMVTNGIIEIRYDPSSTALNAVENQLDHKSINVDTENGIITIVYVSKDGVSPENYLVKLSFKSNKCVCGAITVIHKERNNQFNLSDIEQYQFEGRHDWNYGCVRWNHINGHTASVLYTCSECGSCQYQAMHMSKVVMPLYTIYTGYLSAEESLDGNEHTATYREIVKIKPRIIVKPDPIFVKRP